MVDGNLNTKSNFDNIEINKKDMLLSENLKAENTKTQKMKEFEAGTVDELLAAVEKDDLILDDMGYFYDSEGKDEDLDRPDITYKLDEDGNIYNPDQSNIDNNIVRN